MIIRRTITRETRLWAPEQDAAHCLLTHRRDVKDDDRAFTAVVIALGFLPCLLELLALFLRVTAAFNRVLGGSLPSRMQDSVHSATLSSQLKNSQLQFRHSHSVAKSYRVAAGIRS
jgi:hypothetical protein